MIVEILKSKTKRLGNRVRCICDNCDGEFIDKYSEQIRRNKKNHFCCRDCYVKYTVGEGSPNYRNGKGSYRDIFERHYGIKLNSKQAIHHINGDRTDNRIENLSLIPLGEHIYLHNKLRGAKKSSQIPTIVGIG
jgi:hypothetical protein